MKYLIIVLE